VLYARCPGDCNVCPYRNLPLVYRLKSRRRGDSLGVNLYPGWKVCSFDCIYCFRGPTIVKTPFPVDPGYPKPRDLEEALELALKDSVDVSSIDFSGNGEPTLHRSFAEFVSVVRAVADRYGIPASLGVFTNSSTLNQRRVAEALGHLDHVEAKLDTVDPIKFEALNRPAEGLSLQRIVEGLRSLRKNYEGVLAVQVMLVDTGLFTNSTREDAEALARVLNDVELDEVHVYTAYRTPKLSGVSKPPRHLFEAFVKELERTGFKVKAYYE
jgi:wyosine [tRNA(Phe)-imidazoG37] synthetase (radical SAM superfamily)